MHASGASRREIAKLRLMNTSAPHTLSRHCERSEAIHLPFFTRQDGLLRFARNDGSAVLKIESNNPPVMPGLGHPYREGAS